MLSIYVPDNSIPERTYITDVVVKECLGIDYQLRTHEYNYVCFEVDGIALKVLDGLLINYSPLNFKSDNVEIRWIALEALGIPANVILHKEIPVIRDPQKTGLSDKQNSRSDEISFDLFGFCFLMVSRVEELRNSDPDKYDRFLSGQSLAARYNFLNRPVVNEYIEILWYYLKKTFPALKRKLHHFKIQPTHDVDIPYGYQIKTYYELIKRCGVDVLKNLEPERIPSNFRKFKAYKKKGVKADPLYTFEFIMESSEKNGLQSEFYFITDQKKLPVNCSPYLTTDKPIIDLLKNIHQRGHVIGVHPSYNTYLDKFQMKKEFTILKNSCEKLGITQNSWGGRQHILRWRTPDTARNFEFAGADYDSTLSFADVAGFRCGICYEYTMFDVLERRPLNIKQRPLVAMEVSIIGKRYMNRGIGPKALSYFNQLKEECKFYNGIYTLLWHNNTLVSEEERELYLNVISI